MPSVLFTRLVRPRLRLDVAIAMLLPLISACERLGSTAAQPPSAEGVDGADAGARVEVDHGLSGAVAGSTFSGGVTSLAVAGDAADRRMVVYVFSQPATCLDLSFSGWDEHRPDGTMVVSFEVMNPSPGTFAVTTNEALRSGEASVTFTRWTGAGPPRQLRADRGTVVLRAVTNNRSVAGRVVLWFGRDRLSGDFDATFCSTGHEP
jgi:hypothetical protein